MRKVAPIPKPIPKQREKKSHVSVARRQGSGISVQCHMSRDTCHLFHVTCHLSLAPTATATATTLPLLTTQYAQYYCATVTVGWLATTQKQYLVLKAQQIMESVKYVYRSKGMPILVIRDLYTESA